MDGIRVFVIGKTVLAEIVAHLLRDSGLIQEIEWFEEIPDAIVSIKTSPPDVLILVDITVTELKGELPLLLVCQDIPIICTDCESTDMKLITTTYVTATPQDFLKIITTVKTMPNLFKGEVLL